MNLADFCYRGNTPAEMAKAVFEYLPATTWRPVTPGATGMRYKEFRAVVSHGLVKLYDGYVQNGSSVSITNAVCMEVNKLVPIIVYEIPTLAQEHARAYRQAVLHSTQQLTTEETTMTIKNIPTTKLFEKRIFINGQNADDMSDDQIFQAIAQAENEVKQLELIENRPGKLERKIEKLKGQIHKVLKYVDER